MLSSLCIFCKFTPPVHSDFLNVHIERNPQYRFEKLAIKESDVTVRLLCVRNIASAVNTSGSSCSWSPDCSIFMKKRGQKVINVSGIGLALAQYAVNLITFFFKGLTRVLQRYLGLRRGMLQEMPVYTASVLPQCKCLEMMKQHDFAFSC